LGQNGFNLVCICWQKPTVAGREFLYADEGVRRRRKSSLGSRVAPAITNLAEDGGRAGGSWRC